MDADKIKKLTEEIEQQLIHLTEGNEHQRIMIRRATKAIRDEIIAFTRRQMTAEEKAKWSASFKRAMK